MMILFQRSFVGRALTKLMRMSKSFDLIAEIEDVWMAGTDDTITGFRAILKHPRYVSSYCQFSQSGTRLGR